MKKIRVIKFSKLINKYGGTKSLINSNKYNTLIIDKYGPYYNIYNLINSRLYNNLENIIFDDDVILKNITINTRKTNIKNIIASKRKDLAGITIDYDILLNLESQIDIFSYNNNISKINIVFDEKVEEIEINPNYYNHIALSNKKNIIRLYINSHEESHSYIVTKNGITIDRKEHVIISNNDVEDNVLDLCKFNEYENVYFDIQKDDIKTLIMSTDFFRESYNIFHFDLDNIKFIDSNDMRLLPEVKTINVGGTLHFISGNNNFLTLFVESNENKIINLYKNGGVEIIDKNYIEENFPNVKKYEIFKDDNYCCAVIEHNKKNKFTIFIDNKRYEINSGFKRYLLLKIADQEICINEESLINNDWNRIFKCQLSASTFDKLYNEYSKDMDKLKQIKDLGISNKTLYYSLAIDFNKNKDLRLFEGLKLMMQHKNITENEVEKIEQFGKTLIKDIKNNRKQVSYK